MTWYDEYKVDVPERQSGDYCVERFEVTEDDAKWERLRSIMAYSARSVPVTPGWYTRLVKGSGLLMSDTPAEVQDHLEAIARAKGHVLINGLGLGVVVQAMLEKPEVEHVTVIEVSPDVIALVGSHYKERFGDRLDIIEADALTWQPPKGIRYDVVWHDIWDSICTDNLPDMHKLHRKYGRRTDWQGSWCRYICEQNKRQGY